MNQAIKESQVTLFLLAVACASIFVISSLKLRSVTRRTALILPAQAVPDPSLICRINNNIFESQRGKDFYFNTIHSQFKEEFIIKHALILTIALMISSTIIMAFASEDAVGITGEQALQKLLEGNLRYAAGNSSHPNQSLERRAELIAGQHPFAVVVGCSDSRIVPEILFDQGLGDIFVIRTAGQVLDNVSIASIEYAVDHLGVPLVVVLGHDGCGAVTAAVNGAEAEGHLGCLVDFIKPAMDKSMENGNESDLLNRTIDRNVFNIVDDLKASEPVLSEKVESGDLMIVGARYSLDSGEVELLEQ